ncbi:MAG TPA: HAD family hydrolase [Acidimicrobiales bacterium]|nr:HAD family hydrolase [Acidimicrobiales bacterium]
MAGPAAFFDLDGTLVDTTYLHAFAWWQALDRAGETRPMAAIHPLIGMGSSGILRTLLGRDDAAIDDAHGACFRELHDLVRPLPGAPDLLHRVAGQGGRVVIVTSAKPQDLGVLLGALDCDDLIADVVGGEDVDREKPAPDPFAVALGRTGADPRRSLAVGDSVWDVEAAAKVQMGCIGLQTGGIAAADLADAGAVATYRGCAELLDAWDGSPLGALLGPR